MKHHEMWNLKSNLIFKGLPLLLHISQQTVSFSFFFSRLTKSGIFSSTTYFYFSSVFPTVSNYDTKYWKVMTKIRWKISSKSGIDFSTKSQFWMPQIHLQGDFQVVASAEKWSHWLVGWDPDQDFAIDIYSRLSHGGDFSYCTARWYSPGTLFSRRQR